jgi:hypothetical protein
LTTTLHASSNSIFEFIKLAVLPAGVARAPVFGLGVGLNFVTIGDVTQSQRSKQPDRKPTAFGPFFLLCEGQVQQLRLGTTHRSLECFFREGVAFISQ